MGMIPPSSKIEKDTKTVNNVMVSNTITTILVIIVLEAVKKVIIIHF